MEPYKAQLFPIEYKISRDIVKLLGEANDKYGQFKTLLKLFKFNQKYFLDSLILGESLRSSRIEGTQISQDDMYYLNFKEQNDSIEEVKNLKKMLDYATITLKTQDFSLNLLNQMHKILLSGVRGKDKNPGEIRNVQNYIGQRNLGKEGATFVPPVPEDVQNLLNNLIDYINNDYEDEVFVKVALTHMQFESIHPYRDGNGRLGRALISLQLSKLKGDEPILFLSEIIETFKLNYYNSLNECRTGNYEPFIKFFLQSVIDQCRININRINAISKIYDEDEEIIKLKVKGTTALRLHPLMMKKIVFTASEMATELNVHINTIQIILNKLIDLKMIVKEKKNNTNRITYRYKKVYDVFVDKM